VVSTGSTTSAGSTTSVGSTTNAGSTSGNVVSLTPTTDVGSTGGGGEYVPPVSRSALREAKRVAEETGDTQLLEALTGAIRAVPEPEAVTSQIPIQTANWRAVWGLENTSRAALRKAATGEVDSEAVVKQTSEEREGQQ